MPQESAGSFECACGHTYELRWSEIRFGEPWPCRHCPRVIQILCAEQWQPQERETSRATNNVIPFRRAA